MIEGGKIMKAHTLNSPIPYCSSAEELAKGAQLMQNKTMYTHSFTIGMSEIKAILSTTELQTCQQGNSRVTMNNPIKRNIKNKKKL
jgi:hypothetical protein